MIPMPNSPGRARRFRSLTGSVWALARAGAGPSAGVELAGRLARGP